MLECNGHLVAKLNRDVTLLFRNATLAFVRDCRDYKVAVTSTCKATFLFVIVFLKPYSYNATCDASRN